MTPIYTKKLGWASAAVFLALFCTLWVSNQVAFDAPFYFDTKAHLEDKANLHVVELSWQSLRDATRADFDRGGVYRPVSYLSLGLNYYLSGLAPRGFRIMNLIIHGVAALSLLFLLGSVAATPRLRTAATGGRQTNYWPAAFLAVALWALHPIQTNVTTYIIQRMASLSGLFTFLSVGAYLRARSKETGFGWGWGACSLCAFLLAIGSKESAVSVLPLLFVAEITLLTPPTTPRVRRALWVLAAIGLGLVAVVFFWTGEEPWSFLTRLSTSREFTPIERLWTEIRLQPRYLRLLLVPDPRPLTLAADIGISRSLLSPPTTALAAAGILAALLLAWKMVRTNPLLSFGILWFFAAQLVEGTVLPLELYFEHRMYVPSVFLYLGVATLVFRLPLPNRFRKAGLTCVVIVLVVGSAFGTYARNVVWADPLRFWHDQIEKSPRVARGYTNLGRYLVEAEDYPAAREAFQVALALEGKTNEVLLNLATLSYREGDRAAARRFFDEAIELKDDDYARAYRGRAHLSLEEGSFEQAEADVLVALKLRDTDPESWHILALAQLFRGRNDRAIEAALRSVRYGPTEGKYWNALGAAYYKKRSYPEAIRGFEKAVALVPENEEFRTNLENVSVEARANADTH